MLYKLTKEERATVHWYDINALLWSEKHGLGNAIRNSHTDIQGLFKLLPEGKILEIGTGYGGDATELIIRYGVNNYVGIEPAKGLLEIAQTRNPGADIKQLSVYDLDFPQNAFDGFWTNATLIHIPKRRLQTALGNIYRVVKTGGIGFISIMEGNSDMENGRPGRYYSLWSENEFIDELMHAGYKVVSKKKD